MLRCFTDGGGVKALSQKSWYSDFERSKAVFHTNISIIVKVRYSANAFLAWIRQESLG